MITGIWKRMVAFVAVVVMAGGARAGDLTPPGAPAPTMKTLQEIWDRLGSLETQMQSQRSENAGQALLLENAGVVLPWSMAVITNFGGNFYEYSLNYVLSPQGSPAVYWRVGVENVFAQRAGSGWSFSGDYEGQTIVGQTLAFSPEGTPIHAASWFTSIVVRTFSQGSWTNLDEVVFTGTNNPGYAAMLRAPDGNLAISYVSVPDNTLRYLKKSGGVWSNTVLGAAENLEPSLAFDSSGNPMIAYRGAGGAIEFAWFDGATSAWSNETVEATDGYAPHMAASPSGVPYISYFYWDGFQNLVRVASRDGTPWQYMDVDTTGGGGGPITRIAFGPGGRPAVAHSTFGSGLRLAEQNPSLVWVASDVDTNGGVDQVGQSVVLRFTPGGFASMVYWDDALNQLKYAIRAPYTQP